MKLGYLAVGQYRTIELTDARKHPRGQLLRELGISSARNVYIDGNDGKPQHIGYIAAGEWWTIYEVSEWQGRGGR